MTGCETRPKEINPGVRMMCLHVMVCMLWSTYHTNSMHLRPYQPMPTILTACPYDHITLCRIWCACLPAYHTNTMPPPVPIGLDANPMPDLVCL